MPLRRFQRIKLEILSPVTGFVDSKNIVNGVIDPPGPVQVLVFCADKKWHLQAETTLDGIRGVRGAYWSAVCSFGPQNGFAGSYDIVAIAGDSIRERMIDSIPDWLPRSRVIHVRRSRKPPAGFDHPRGSSTFING